MTLEHPIFEAKCVPHGIIGWFPKATDAVKWLELHRSISTGCVELNVKPLVNGKPVDVVPGFNAK
jgi:hypothetical protein